MKSFAKFFVFLLLGVWISACSSGAVNEIATLPVVPMGPAVVKDAARKNRELGPESMPRISALSGTVVIQQEPAGLPVNGATVQLFFLENEGRKLLSETTTGPDGRFDFSRKLPGGNYLLSVRGRKFSGQKRIQLTDAPVADIILEVREASK